MSNADRPKTEGWAYSQGIDDLEPGADGVFRLYQSLRGNRPSLHGQGDGTHLVGPRASYDRQ